MSSIFTKQYSTRGEMCSWYQCWLEKLYCLPRQQLVGVSSHKLMCIVSFNFLTKRPNICSPSQTVESLSVLGRAPPLRSQHWKKLQHMTFSSRNTILFSRKNLACCYCGIKILFLVFAWGEQLWRKSKIVWFSTTEISYTFKRSNIITLWDFMGDLVWGNEIWKVHFVSLSNFELRKKTSNPVKYQS